MCTSIFFLLLYSFIGLGCRITKLILFRLALGVHVRAYSDTHANQHANYDASHHPCT
jgi:hypothetical protein